MIKLLPNGLEEHPMRGKIDRQSAAVLLIGWMVALIVTWM